MLKTKAIRKIFTTTLTMFIILTIFTIPMTTKNKNILRTNLEIEDITNLSTNKVYLLNKDNLLVRVDAFIGGSNTEEKVRNIIEYLTINNNKIPSGLNGYIPKGTKTINVSLDEDCVVVDLSKEFFKYRNITEEEIVTGIAYSILEIAEVNSVNILVEGSYLENYKEHITKDIGINNEYLINSFQDLNKVVVYYLDNIYDNLYYVPVTKYLNDKRDKIEIIVDELKNNNSNNLISYIHNDLKLLDYREESDVLFLNFNDYLMDTNKEVSDNVLKTIAYSALSNYDINMVMFEVNGEEVNYISRKDM